MKIQVGGLSDGVHQYSFQVESTDLGLNGSFTEDVIIDTTLDKTGNQLLLKATIRAAGTFECDRCILQFKRMLESSYQMYYVTEGAEHGQVDPSEIQIIPAGLNVIDIAEDVRQTILLSVPLKLLCSDSCEGLCPHCGANLNTERCTCTETVTDSRWEKLSTLQKKNLKDRN
jgi:uncharacterized protein